MQSASHFTKGEISPCGGYVCSTVGLSGGGYKKIWLKAKQLEKQFVSNVRYAAKVYSNSSDETRKYAQKIVGSMSRITLERLIKSMLKNPADIEELLLNAILAIPRNRLAGGFERPFLNELRDEQRIRNDLDLQRRIIARSAQRRELRQQRIARITAPLFWSCFFIIYVRFLRALYIGDPH